MNVHILLVIRCQQNEPPRVAIVSSHAQAGPCLPFQSYPLKIQVSLEFLQRGLRVLLLCRYNKVFVGLYNLHEIAFRNVSIEKLSLCVKEKRVTICCAFE